MAREIKQWITINGVHVPIFEGQSKGDAVRGFLDKVEKTKEIKYPKSGFKNANKDEKTKQEQIAKNQAEKDKLNGKRENKVNINNVTDANNHKELVNKLKSSGLSLDSADAHTMERGNSLNGEKVTMYDKDGNEYRGTYNKYSDGGREIVNIKKTGSEQIAKNEEQKKQLNGTKISDTMSHNKQIIQDAMNNGRTGSDLERFKEKYKLNSINEAETIIKAIRMGQDWHQVYEDKYGQTYEKMINDKENEAVKAQLRAEKANNDVSKTGSGKAVDKAKEDIEPKKGTKEWRQWMQGDKNSQVWEGTVNKVNINDEPSKQLLVRLEELANGDEPIGKFWDGSAELSSIYDQLIAANFKFTQEHSAQFHQYYRYYNDGDLPGWARGIYNEFAKSSYDKAWGGYRTKLNGHGEIELERRVNKALVAEYRRYLKKNKK